MYKKSKNIAVDMLPKSFKGAKCKTSLKLAMSRIKLMRNKKEIQVKQMRRDLAQLLEAGQEQTARIRVEHVIREEKTLSAYELIDIYCELIVARLPIIESQKSCPIDLREAIAGVVFASPRCADIPELMDVRKQFLAKYGKEFIASALEVRPDCGVSRLLVEKLSARAPDGQTKVKVMTSIAEEHNIKWDPKPFEDQLQKPNEDLLAGPSTFASVNQTPVKSSNFTATASSMNEPSARMSQNDIPSKATGFNASSAATINTPSTSLPSVSHSNPDKMEGRSAWQEVNSANRMESGSLNRQNWNMEFKDATSAAQAAAESAERASMAARAAAELARRGSASYDMNDGLDRSEFTKAKDDYATKESVPMPYNEVKPSQGMQMRRESRKIDDVLQASSRTEAEETYDGYASVPRSSGQSLYHSSEISGRNDHLEINQKVDGRTPVRIQSSISKSEPLVQNYEDNQDDYDDYEEEIRNDNYGKSASRSSFGDDTRWNSNSQIHANYEKSEIGAREGSFGGDQTVFDDYGFDEDDKLLGTISSQQEEKQFGYLPTKDEFSPKQHESSFTVEDRSPQWMFETTESHPKDVVETNEKGYHSPQFDDNSAAFDDYDDHNYEGEDVFDKIMHEEVMEPSKVPFDQNNSSESSLSARSSQEPDKSHSFLNKEVEEANEIHLPSVHSDGSEKIHEADPGSPDRKWKGSSSNRLSSDKSIHNENASWNSINSENEPFYNPMEEKPQSRGPSRVPSLEAESNNTVRMTSDSGISNDSSYDSVEELKWGGRLTGGFKHKGFPRPPYQKDPLPNVSAPSKQSAVYQPSNEIESSYGEEYDQEPHSQTYLSKSRASSVISDFSKDKSSESKYTAERRGRTDEDPSPGNSSGNIENHNFSYQKRESAKLEHSAYKSYGARTLRQDRKEYSSESYSIPDFPSTLSKDNNLDVTRPETPKQAVSDRERGAKTNMQSRLKMPLGYFDEDADEADTSEPYHTFRSEGKRGVKLSRRTRALPSEGKRANNSRFTTQSNDPGGDVEKRPQSNSVSEPLNLERRESSESSQTKLSPEQPSVTPQAEPPKNKEIPKSSKLASVDSGAPVSSGIPKTSSSTEGLSSREDSLKKSSHVHPKLPDYEYLAAHFHSLRSNVRPQ